MENTSISMSLNHCFQSYETSVCPAVAKACKEFFGYDFGVKLVSLSYEPEFFWKDSEYFVTQINHTNDFFLVLKVSNVAANLFFLESLGKRQKETGFLRLKNITELEAHVLTAYNEFVYKQLSELLLNQKEINSILHTLKEEKTIYLTFYINGDSEYEAGKIILSCPEFMFRKIEQVPPPEQPLDYEFFKNSRVETNILIGKTRATLEDIQNIEVEDIIILEDSDLYRMYLQDFDGIGINVNPSHSIVIDFDNDDNGDNGIVSDVKETNVNIWDSLEVDVSASFEKVKMKLGDLREITEGLVVDVASISGNKVFLEVENRYLAAGELIIVGDKYGVRITELSREAKAREVEKLEEEAVVAKEMPAPVKVQEDNYDEEMELEEDLDDSDFELDDDEDEIDEEEEY